MMRPPCIAKDCVIDTHNYHRYLRDMLVPDVI